MKQSKAAIFVLLAGALWGSMGLFVRRLNAAGLYAMDVVLARMLSALLFMGIFMLLFSRESFRIRLKDLWCFLGSGIVSLLLFSLCYFSGMQVTSLNVMAVLLYTSPAIIMILSVVLFHEKLTKRKLLALVMTFAGCCLVSGIGSESAVSMQGLLLGLGAGYLLMRLLEDMLGMTLTMSAGVAELAIGFSMAVGVIFGLYPADKASKLKPIDALHYD